MAGDKMKKLDLHIHTKQTVSDSPFEFSLEKLKEYVKTMRIDGIAVVNHNKFDLKQFYEIQEALNELCVVLPGIEINIGITGFGHIICIADIEEVQMFDSKCQLIEAKITNNTEKITPDELKNIFSDMDKYLWIPHYDKKPAVEKNVLSSLEDFILCGEVASVKKFIYAQKDNDVLVPVYFSDFRPSEKSEPLPIRQTFFDIQEISVKSIKKALLEKSHVSLSENEGYSQFYILPDLPISTGLNVIIGERSSGKTYTLEQINQSQENIKYIKQFELIETDPEKAAKEFSDKIANKRNGLIQDYFEAFNHVVNDVKEISIRENEKSVEEYINSLVKYAKETDRADMFAKCTLYAETKFPTRKLDGINEVIEAVERLLDARDNRDIIEKHVKRENLIALREELLQKAIAENCCFLKESWVNDVVTKIKRTLRRKTAATTIPEIDFYGIQMDKAKVDKFNDISELVKQEKIISLKEIEDFYIQIKKRPFISPQELKNLSGKRTTSFSKIMDNYRDNPYSYLMDLKEMPELSESDYYKFFACVDYNILNKYGANVSGGERAEFNLLEKIQDANLYDFLLIDEPESSFDNLFLKGKVNHIIREMANNMPVILVTHNNTVGASIKPDYIIYTKREIIDGKAKYLRYCGLPSDKMLKCSSGEEISNFDVMLNCLEAGEESYRERERDYELLKN